MKLMQLNISYPSLPHRNSVRAAQVMDYFGIGPDTSERIIAHDLEIPIECGDVVLFTGPSGSGKSSLLKSVKSQVPCANEMLELGTCLSSSAASNSTLVDLIPLPFEEALQLLSMCGLGEAPLLLRTPQELSEGQRYRFLIAMAIAQKPRWIVADEFTAVLDRTTAKVITYNIRRLADRFGIGFLLATAIDDVADDLQPDLLVQCDLDGRVVVERYTGKGESPETTGKLEVEHSDTNHPGADATRSLNRKKKTTHIVPLRVVAQRCLQIRLAVFRSVALSQSPDRLDEVWSPAVASKPADRHLFVCGASPITPAAQPVLWTSRHLASCRHAGAQSAAGHITASCDPPHLSRCRSRLRVRATCV